MEFKKILNGKYLYYSNCNILINHEFKHKFEKHMESHRIIPNRIELTEEILKKNISDLNQIIFETTQKCNLRCKYCIYSGKYEYRRNHSKLNMTSFVAKKAIDYFSTIIKGGHDLFISFYGGEPLLNFKFIKEVVEYSEAKLKNFNKIFAITTNGTILCDSILDYLVKKNFLITISLDGPKYIHDKNRLFLNSKGSFDRIKNNINNIYKNNKKFFLTNIDLHATVKYDNSFVDVYEFFCSDGLLKQLDISFSTIDNINLKENDIDFNNMHNFHCEYENILKEIKKKIKNEIKLHPIENFFLRPIRKIKEILGSSNLNDCSGACFFNRRVYVNLDGDFFVCERVNETFPIGNINEGFHYKKMAETYLKFRKVVNEKCSICDIRNFCSICYASINANNEFVFPDNFCSSRKFSKIQLLEDYIKIKEEGLSI